MTMIRIFLKIFRVMAALILGVLLAASVFNAWQLIMGQEMPMLFGYGKAVVVTGSMEPEIMPNDMVVFHAQDEYEAGDIVIYQSNSFITHRVVEVTENGYITQGDANNVADEEITAGQVVGKVILIIPKVGYITEFLSEPFGILVLMIGFVALLELPRLFGKRSKRR